MNGFGEFELITRKDIADEILKKYKSDKKEDIKKTYVIDKITESTFNTLIIFKPRANSIDPNEIFNLALFIGNIISIVPPIIAEKMEMALGNYNEKLPYEHVDRPQHYNNYNIEVIDMMVQIWGKEATSVFCEMNAFKYRMRMGTKPENAIEQDLKKEGWYLNKAKTIKQQ